MLFLRQPCLGGVVLPRTGWTHWSFCFYLSFCSLMAFSTSSEGQSKKWLHPNLCPRTEKQQSALHEALQDRVSVSVCAAENCSLLRCMSTVTLPEVILGAPACPCLCASKMPRSCELVHAPSAPGSCLDTALKPLLSCYCSESFC